MQKTLRSYGYKGDFLVYNDVLPKGCPPHPSQNHKFVEGQGCVPYAFKAYMMKEAQISGYRYIGWLDSVTQLQNPFSMVEKIIAKYGYLLGRNDCDLGLYTSDACLKHFRMERSEISGKPCIYGNIMFLDLKMGKCHRFLDKMLALAYVGGPYCADWENDNGQVSKDLRVKGHRPQQSVATIVAMKLGLTNFVPDIVTYAKSPERPDCIFRAV